MDGVGQPARGRLARVRSSVGVGRIVVEVDAVEAERHAEGAEVGVDVVDVGA